MPNEHWFDVIYRSAMQATSRRELVRVVAVVAPALVFGRVASSKKNKSKATGKAKNKGNGKKKGKGKDKPKPNPPARCGEESCAAEWPDDDFNRNDCELKCGTCSGGAILGCFPEAAT